MIIHKLSLSHKKFGPDRFSRFDVYWIQGLPEVHYGIPEGKYGLPEINYEIPEVKHGKLKKSNGLQEVTYGMLESKYCIPEVTCGIINPFKI